MRNSRHRFIRFMTHFASALLFGAAFTIGSTSVRAQEVGRVTGVVTGDGGQPLPDVQVALVGTALGGLTDERGRFNIVSVPAGGYQLRAQRIGYRPAMQSITVTAGEALTVNLSLEAAPTALTKQVIVGYTTQQRKDVSDATTTVTAEDISDQQVATLEEALRGRAPGVAVTASGEPGRPAQIIVRGQNILGNPTPLYVVDGMYLRQNPNLNPSDIESIEILKDASATAQYGAEASNGVVIVRTRRGRPSDNNRVDLRSYFGVQDVPRRIDMMSAREWAAVQKQAYDNIGAPVPQGVTDALAGEGPNTDWQDAIFNRGRIQEHNLSLSGGATNASYLISGGFLEQQGSVIETSFRRYNFRVNSEVRRGRFTLGENVALSRSRQEELTGSPLIDAMRMLPTIPVRDTLSPSGYGYGSGANPTFGTNPVGLLETRPRDRRSNQVIGTVYGEAQLFSRLRYRLNLGMNYENFGRTSFNSIDQLRFGPAGEFAELTEVRNDYTSLLSEHLLMFDNQNTTSSHRLNAVAGLVNRQNNFDDISGYRQRFSNENLRVLDAGSQVNLANSGAVGEEGVRGYLMRANYTFLERYILTGSLRRDCSSRFGAENPCGNFNAFSLGWIVSDEGFFKSTPLLGRTGFLKLRASTGTQGNQDIGNYRFNAPIDQNNLNYPIGGAVQTGATQLRLANPRIRWQENKQDNLGVDMNLMGERMTITGDVYRNTSKGLLVEAPVPWSLGVGLDRSRSPTVNAGSMENSGKELGVIMRWGDREGGGLHLNTSASYSTTRNKVLSLGNGGQPIFDGLGVARTAVGGAIGEFYVIRTGGIFQSAEEVQAHTTTLANGDVVVVQPGAQPGDIRFIDANRDGRINDDDRVNVGNGTPKFSGGLFFDGGIGMFDFALNFRGAGGFKIFNRAKYWSDRMDDPSNYRSGFQPWTPENRSNTTPRALASGNDNARLNSDRWVEDGGFIKLQNIVLGVRLPPTLAARFGAGVAESRLYINMQNIYTWTDFSNWDPEALGTGDPLARGIDDGSIYPNVRTISIGLDLRL